MDRPGDFAAPCRGCARGAFCLDGLSAALSENGENYSKVHVSAADALTIAHFHDQAGEDASLTDRVRALKPMLSANLDDAHVAFLLENAADLAAETDGPLLPAAPNPDEIIIPVRVTTCVACNALLPEASTTKEVDPLRGDGKARSKKAKSADKLSVKGALVLTMSGTRVTQLRYKRCGCGLMHFFKHAERRMVFGDASQPRRVQYYVYPDFDTGEFLQLTPKLIIEIRILKSIKHRVFLGHASYQKSCELIDLEIGVPTLEPHNQSIRLALDRFLIFETLRDSDNSTRCKLLRGFDVEIDPAQDATFAKRNLAELMNDSTFAAWVDRETFPDKLFDTVLMRWLDHRCASKEGNEALCNIRVHDGNMKAWRRQCLFCWRTPGRDSRFCGLGDRDGHSIAKDADLATTAPMGAPAGYTAIVERIETGDRNDDDVLARDPVEPRAFVDDAENYADCETSDEESALDAQQAAEGYMLIGAILKERTIRCQKQVRIRWKKTGGDDADSWEEFDRLNEVTRHAWNTRTLKGKPLYINEKPPEHDGTVSRTEVNVMDYEVARKLENVEEEKASSPSARARHPPLGDPSPLPVAGACVQHGEGPIETVGADGRHPRVYRHVRRLAPVPRDVQGRGQDRGPHCARRGRSRGAPQRRAAEHAGPLRRRVPPLGARRVADGRELGVRLPRLLRHHHGNLPLPRPHRPELRASAASARGTFRRPDRRGRLKTRASTHLRRTSTRAARPRASTRLRRSANTTRAPSIVPAADPRV